MIEIERYLNSVQTMSAKFIQISATGKVETGIIFFKNPDRLRFEYDRPLENIILANGPSLILFDKKSPKIPQKYLTSQTPLSFLLKDPIQLNDSRFVKKITVEQNLFHLSLHDKERPKLGEIELLFANNPIEFKEWVITSFSGEKTRLLFEDIQVNQPVPESLFNIQKQIESFLKDAN